MKNLFTVLLLTLSLSLTAQNYSYFDNDIRFYNQDIQPVVTLSHFGAFPITEKFGFTDYAVIEGNNEDTYATVLLGGYYNITDELSVYLMAGKENLSSDNSIYVGGRYMTYYGVGVPLSIRQSLSETSNIYLGYTTYYDTNDYYDGDWLPTLTLAFEFL